MNKEKIDSESNFVVKTDFKMVFIKWSGLILAQYVAMTGMLFAQLMQHHNVSYTLKVIFALFLALIPSAFLVSLLGWKRLIVKENEITYRSLTRRKKFRLEQITECMLSAGMLFFWIDGREYKVLVDDFDYDGLAKFKGYLEKNGIGVR